MKPDERQQTEFLQMLSQCEGILIKVCRYFTRRRPSDFRDLYQEIVCTLWESWPEYRGESAPATWVTRIALNVAGQEIRKRKRMPLFVEYDESIHDILSDPLPAPLPSHRQPPGRLRPQTPLPLHRPSSSPRNRRHHRHHRSRRQATPLPHPATIDRNKTTRY